MLVETSPVPAPVHAREPDRTVVTMHTTGIAVSAALIDDRGEAAARQTVRIEPSAGCEALVDAPEATRLRLWADVLERAAGRLRDDAAVLR